MGLLGTIGKIGGLAAGLVGSTIGLVAGGLLDSIFGLNKKKQPPLLPPPTIDDARQKTRDEDALRRRQGAAADILTGTGGAEAGPASVGRLVVGS